ncbi:MAG: hypothetical protein P4L71_14130 [Acetobacteraceae bacterium]|nr:hypothetical protein [Acetobacteraceae bacterium]
MPPISETAFETLLAQTGIPFDAAQKKMLHTAYPMLAAMIERVTAPMPREAEPALIFHPEIG